jgi:hydrogenase nickel incorporation protein HypB
MCATCGCSGTVEMRLISPGGGDPVPAPRAAEDSRTHPSGHSHQHGHKHGHEHSHDSGGSRTVVLQEKVLARNDALAQRNRDWLRRRGVLAINVMSAPGAGKTTLLERTAQDLATELLISVIEGDQETALDAERMRRAGCRVVQINTGAGCHLDAAMVGDALRSLDPPEGSVVVIENVGNLVCPALFDLGEAASVVVASVTEGAEKPVKYPHMFRRADLVLVSKTDLLPYVDFDLTRFNADVARVSPGARVVPLSAKSGEGTWKWHAWLRQQRPWPPPPPPARS